MQRNRIAAERVDDEHVEPLWLLLSQLSFHDDARIANENVEIDTSPFGIALKGKIFLRKLDDERIDLIVTDHVARPTVATDRTGAQTHHTQPEWTLCGNKTGVTFNCQPNATLSFVVQRGSLVLTWQVKLNPMNRIAVDS